MDIQVKGAISADKAAYIANIIVLILAVISVTDPTLFGINPAHIAWVSAVLNIVLRYLTKGPESILLVGRGVKPKE